MSGEKYTVLLDEDDASNTLAAGLFNDYTEAENYRIRHWVGDDFEGRSRVIQIEPAWGIEE